MAGSPRKLPEARELAFLLKCGEGPRAIARRFGVSPGTVAAALRIAGLSTPRRRVDESRDGQ